jgi:hypothetical protein
MLKTYPTISYTGLEKRKKTSWITIVKNIKEGMNIEEFKQTSFFQKQFKKLKKAEYILDNVYNFEFKTNQPKPKYLINHFAVEKDYDYWKNVYVFNTTDMDNVLNDLDKMDIEIKGSTWTSPYDCTGRTLFQACDFIPLTDRIIVIQVGMLDV